MCARGLAAGRGRAPQATPFHMPRPTPRTVFFVPLVAGAVTETLAFSEGRGCQTICCGGREDGGTQRLCRTNCRRSGWLRTPRQRSALWWPGLALGAEEG